MINRIIHFSLRHAAFVIVAALGLIGVGLYSAWHLPMDALPDITPLQIQINTTKAALAPEEIEKQLTLPIEQAMRGFSGLQRMRSLSKFGFSQVTLIFDEKRDVFQLRQFIAERLQSLADQLPLGVQPVIQPVSSGLGEIFYYGVEYKANAPQRRESREQQLMDLKILQDYTIAPWMLEVSGVGEVSTSGGFLKQIVIEPDLDKLNSSGLSLDDLAKAVQQNTENTGGGVFQRAGQQIIIRHAGQIQEVETLRQLPLRLGANGKPVLIQDVAKIGIGHPPRAGGATRDGEEAVIGAVIMLRGENTRIVTERVREKLREIQEKLPAGVELTTLYDRGDLINRAVHTVKSNLLEGALFVVIVLFVFLGNWRAALIVALAIPLSLLIAMTGMVQWNITGSLISLGAIDFGLIVDGAVVMVENIIRHLGHKQAALGRKLEATERFQTILEACQEVAQPVVFGMTIIILVYLPIFALTGVEGKMFTPLAATVVIALLGALLLALTLVPALCYLCLTGNIKEKENRIVNGAKKIYLYLLERSLNKSGLLILGAIGLCAISVFLIMHRGAEFIPNLDEGSSMVIFQRAPSIGLDAALQLQKKSDKLLLEKFPEIRYVYARIGTDDKAVDPVGLNLADTTVIFNPRETWRKVDGKRMDKDQLTDLMNEELSQAIPGQTMEFSQPIEDRFNDALAGARADVSILIYGEDFDLLTKLANQTQAIVKTIPGAADVNTEAFGKAPLLEIVPKRDVLQQFSLNAADIGRVVSSGLAGEKIGALPEGDRLVDIFLRLPEEVRQDTSRLHNLPVRLSDGGFISLEKVADFVLSEKVNEIQRDAGRRRATVSVNIRGRDLAGFVAEAKQKIQTGLVLPTDYYLEFGGQFKNLESAQARLWLVVPMALCLIFALIYWAFGSLRQALLIYTGIPFAVTGGIFALWLRDLPLSIPAVIGFIALSGVAMLNGIVLLSYFNKKQASGIILKDVVIEGSMTRLRPVLMTALVASLGFIPMALATGSGAEVQRPLATVVIGGILSSTLLTLGLLPVLYFKFMKLKYCNFPISEMCPISK